MMDRDRTTRTGVRAPGVEQFNVARTVVHRRAGCSDTVRRERCCCGEHEGRRQTRQRSEAAMTRKAPPDKPALKPYWGKPAVRNFRGTMETSASYEARSAPLFYPLEARLAKWAKPMSLNFLKMSMRL